jgi:hypothetical protein
MALLIRKQTKLFPNINTRTILTKQTAPRPVVPPSIPKIVTKALMSSKDAVFEAFTWLKKVVKTQADKNYKEADKYFKNMPNEYFAVFLKYGYVVLKTPVDIVAASAILIMYGGQEFIVKPSFNHLVEAFREIRAKGFLSAIASAFSNKPQLLNLTPEQIFDSLPEAIKKDLIDHGYTRDSPTFAALVPALGQGVRKCDEDDCIKSLTDGQDRSNLKSKLEGILKKLELNAEDEFLKFQIKVIDLLNDRFSIFAKFQQKVIEELYKIGTPLIPEVKANFFQILEPKQHQSDIEQMEEIYKEFDYDNYDNYDNGDNEELR